MRVLLEIEEGLDSYGKDGIASVLTAIGHQVIRWNPAIKPAFDAFDEIEPHIFLATDKWMTKRDVVKCMNTRRNLKHASMDSIPIAADTFQYSPGDKRVDLASQVAYIGRYVPPIHDKYLIPLCFPELQIQVKICGPGPWPVAQYLGDIKTENIRHFYASAMTSLSFGRIKQIYQILMSGGLPILINSAAPFDDPTRLVIVKHTDELVNAVRTFTNRKNLNVRDKLIEAGRDVIRQGNTYWHRVTELFELWGLTAEAKRTMDIYNETVKF